MSPSEPDPRPDRFESTRWGLVLAASGRAASSGSGESGAAEALAELCAAYWYPLYAFIRRREHDPDRAADLTQGFFERLLEPGGLGSVDPSRGRFRAFLLAACKNFLANERDREAAAKRGGGRPILSIDCRDAEGRYLAEPAHDLTPERLFERRWALTLLDRSLDQLDRESRIDGKGELFDALRPALTGDDRGRTYVEIGEALGMTEAAVKKAAQRLRGRFREILRERIAATVDDPSEVDDEVRALFSALAT